MEGDINISNWLANLWIRMISKSNYTSIKTFFKKQQPRSTNPSLARTCPSQFKWSSYYLYRMIRRNFILQFHLCPRLITLTLSLRWHGNRTWYSSTRTKKHGNPKEVLIRTHSTSCWHFNPVQCKMRVRMATKDGNGCHLMSRGLIDGKHLP